MTASETAVKSQAEVIAASLGALMMRNNSGVAVDDTGRHIRYGLMNESKRVNSQFKSSDLIGITPVLIGPQHVGRTVGVFTAIETKAAGWKLRPSDDHAQAQLRFINLVRRNGGLAGFVSDPLDVLTLLRLEC